MTQIIQCLNCIYYTNDLKCKAYPDGIPKEILSGEVDHSKPFKNDNGITFKVSMENEIASYLVCIYGDEILSD